MKTLLISFFLLTLSQPLFACWQLSGNLGIDGENFKFNQKCNDDKQYSFPLGNYILHLAIDKNKTKETQSKKFPVHYSIYEKKGAKLILVSKDEDEITEGQSSDIFAKGKEGQPNAIITLNLSNL